MPIQAPFKIVEVILEKEKNVVNLKKDLTFDK